MHMVSLCEEEQHSTDCEITGSCCRASQENRDRSAAASCPHDANAGEPGELHHGFFLLKPGFGLTKTALGINI